MERHFLIVSFFIQGHINPALRLGNRLARTVGATVTFSTTVSAHRRMFPGLATPDQEVNHGPISYIPYSDGYDDGIAPGDGDDGNYPSRSRAIGSKTLSAIIRSLAERGRPVTCIIHSLAWVAEVASDHAIPSAIYWIQPATTFVIFYHYVHGSDGVIPPDGDDPSFTMNIPGLPPLRRRELPSLVTITNPDDPYKWLFKVYEEIFHLLDRQKTSAKPKVLFNTFDELEPDALAAISELKLIAIGPMIATPSLGCVTKEGAHGTACAVADLFKPDEKGYMEWLDSKPRKSVVYVSFGSLHVTEKQQMEEIRRGLEESGRPYLWVVRKDNRSEAAEEKVEEEDAEKKGMVVEWCSQVRVLSHAAVGCFVTHCGWNSTVESVACGVPTVGVPQWMDQGTNARLMELWGTGVRAETNGEGILERAELRRCLEMVMGEGERGKEMRRRAATLREKAEEAVREGGSSDRNLRAFVEEMGM